MLVKNDVVEGAGEAAAKDLDERPVRLRQALGRFEQHDHLAAAPGLDVENGARVVELVASTLEGLAHEHVDLLVERLVGDERRQLPVAAGAGQDGKGLLGIARLAQDKNSRAIDVEQRGDLGQDAFGEALHRAEVEQGRGRLDDDLEAAARLDHALKLLIGPQGRRQGGEELVGGQFGLRLVVVDVVIDDDAPLRRLARLAGAQDDAHRLVPQFAPDVVDEVEPGILALHHHVEQHDGDIRMVAQQRPPLGSRIGRQDLDALSVQGVIVEREARAVVHGGIVVDHGHLPARQRHAGRRAPLVV